MESFKLEIDRLGSVIDLDPMRIREVKKNGRCTFISPKFYNRGIYRVRNYRTSKIEDIAISIKAIVAATYENLEKEIGEKSLDRTLWKDVGEDKEIFFYSFELEEDLVENSINGRSYLEV